MKTVYLFLLTLIPLMSSRGCGEGQNNNAVMVDNIRVRNYLDPNIAVDASRLDEWDVAEDNRTVYSTSFCVVVSLKGPCGEDLSLSGVLITAKVTRTWSEWCTCFLIFPEHGELSFRPAEGAGETEVSGEKVAFGRTKHGQIWLYVTAKDWMPCLIHGTDYYAEVEVRMPRNNHQGSGDIVKTITANFKREPDSDWKNVYAESRMLLHKVKPDKDFAGDWWSEEYVSTESPPPNVAAQPRLRPYDYDMPIIGSSDWSWRQLRCLADGSWSWQDVNDLVVIPRIGGQDGVNTCEPFALFVNSSGLYENDFSVNVAGMPLNMYYLGGEMYCSGYIIPTEDVNEQGIWVDKWGNNVMAVAWPIEFGLENFAYGWLGQFGEDNYDAVYDLWPDGHIEWLDFAKLERTIQ
ncbi:MAG TPA: hypothetical protein HPP87_04600 [Planctomycetes bacterium]|nr:hypothetical protein [Planctomycetota bacterium]HIJ70627.1 hypothetical protein [Planctomycetota bacterium]